MRLAWRALRVDSAALALGASAAAAASVVESARAASVLLSLAQTAAVTALFARGLAGRAEGWANASCALAAAWFALFLGPSWVYAVDPGRLGALISPVRGLALLALSAFALLLGVVAGERLLARFGRDPERHAPRDRTGQFAGCWQRGAG